MAHRSFLDVDHKFVVRGGGFPVDKAHRVLRQIVTRSAKAEGIGDGAGVRDYVAAKIARGSIIAREILGAGKDDEAVAVFVRKLDEFRVYADAEDVACGRKDSMEGVIASLFASQTPAAADAGIGAENEERLDRAGMLDLAETVIMAL